MSIDYQNLHITGEYNRTIVRLKEEELNYLERLCKILEPDNEEQIEAYNKLEEKYNKCRLILFNALEYIEQNYNISKHQDIYKVTLILNSDEYDVIREVLE